MSKLTLSRLIDLLNSVREQCAAIPVQNSSELFDETTKNDLGIWFVGRCAQIPVTLDEAASLLEQHTLHGAANELRAARSTDIIQRWGNINVDGLVRSFAIDDGSANDEVELDRYFSLMGRFARLGEYAKDLLKTIEEAYESELVDDGDAVENALSRQPLSLYKIIRRQKNWVSYATLAASEDPWKERNRPSDETILRALKRLQSELNRLAVPLVIEHSARRVKLDRPSTK